MNLYPYVVSMRHIANLLRFRNATAVTYVGLNHLNRTVREQDICDKEIKNKKELCYNASDQTNKITGDPSYETYYNRRTETS